MLTNHRKQRVAGVRTLRLHLTTLLLALLLSNAASPAWQYEERPASIQNRKEAAIQDLRARLQQAEQKGDQELVTVISMMLRAHDAGIESTSPAASRTTTADTAGQSSLVTVLARLYTYAASYEADGRLEMAAAVYENLLDLGDYRDSRSRLVKLRRKIADQSNRRSMISYYMEDDGAGYPPVPDGSAGESSTTVVEALPPDTMPPFSELVISAGNLPALYQQALRYVEQRDYRHALHVLRTVHALDPGYKDTADLLDAMAAHVEGGDQRWRYLVIGLLICLYLAAFALVAIQPSIRAPLYRLLGQEHKSAALYEQMLQRNPGRVALYPKLAALYVKIGRSDRVARTVYAMTLRLNLRTPNREAIRAALQRSRLAAKPNSALPPADLPPDSES